MATVVYQGFQSCFESQLNEPRALRLRLSSPNPHFFQPLELALKSCSEDTVKRSDNSGGWSFLQDLPCGSPLSNPIPEKERTYVQPSRSNALSEKSLALCTENLGNETGSDITDNDILSLSSSDWETRNCRATETKTLSSPVLKNRKKNAVPSFPPPLTSMRGFQCIQLRPHREDGRLVLQATTEPSRNTCFQAERSNGRLRLWIPRYYDHGENDKEDEEEEDSIAAEYDVEKDEKQEEEESQVMSMESHIQRPGRCAEGDQDNRGLLNWEHFCVATS